MRPFIVRPFACISRVAAAAMARPARHHHLLRRVLGLLLPLGFAALLADGALASAPAHAAAQSILDTGDAAVHSPAAAPSAADCRRMSPRRITPNRPTVRRPTVRRPSVNRPSFDRPVVNRPAVSRPSVRRPAVHRPTFDRPTPRRPIVRTPGTNSFHY